MYKNIILTLLRQLGGMMIGGGLVPMSQTARLYLIEMGLIA